MVNQWKICVLGAKSAGKTTLVKTFLAGKTADEFVSKDPNVLTRDVIFNKHKYIVHVTDFPRCGECLPSLKDYIFAAQCLIVLYSITSRESLNEVQDFLDELWALKGETHIAMVIVGNKLDLERKRVVLDDEGFFMAQKWAVAWLEISAKNSQDANKVFLKAIDEIDVNEYKKLHADPVGEEPKARKCCRVM